MYKKIDYTKWDFTGKGLNILPSLNQHEKEVWNDALKFQDKRNDPGQGAIVVYFTLQLLDLDRRLSRNAILVAILHDTGWSAIDNAHDIHRQAVEEGIVNTAAYRQPHQDQGARIAREILTNLHYKERVINEVCCVIRDHDTRLKQHNRSAQAFMDADLLWRVTVPHRNAYLEELSIKDLTTRLTEVEKGLRSKFFHAVSKVIATMEMENTIEWCKKSKV
jgi:hypothetical protein